MKPLITVGIPTYNGSKYISQAIDSVLKQIVSCKNFVEILISDNCSTDNTSEIVHAYHDKYPGVFSYYKSLKNMGFDNNLNLIFEKAKGKYIWLLSDDDTIVPNALEIICKVLEEDFDYIHLNWSECDQKLKIKKHKAIHLDKDKKFLDFNLFLEKVMTSPVFISSNIFKKNSWKKEANKFIGTGWLHYAKLLSISKISSKTMIVSSPLVKYRWSGGGWKTDHVFNINMAIKLFEIITFYKKFISDKVLRKCINVTFSEIHLEICAARLSGQKIPLDIVNKLETEIRSFSMFNSMCLKLMDAPDFVVKVLYLIFKAKRKLTRIVNSYFKS
ncbi:MAG: glycosyltransferase family 2 protein [Elusimicrobia bacterium]|nr:glycosyltransferase family 2 protein [Elusimicrobiota bacterium]